MEFRSFCGQLLEKNQERFSVLVRGIPQLGNKFEAFISGLKRIRPYCNSKQRCLGPILLRKPGTFYPGIVRYSRPGTRFLGKDS